LAFTQIKVDENTVICGSEDGFLRGISVLPNKILQMLGQHEEEENFPIQSLSLSHCHNFVASSSHDNSIKFYDVSTFVKNRRKEADLQLQN
jgi:WD40 repeat protein